MLNSKLDLRVKLLTFIFNNIDFIDKNVLVDYFSEDSTVKEGALNKIYLLLRERCNFNNYDEVNLLLKKYYRKSDFSEYKDFEELYIFDMFKELGRVLLSHRNGKIILKYWDSNKEQSKIDYLGPYSELNRIAFWNSFSREINIDMLVMQYLATIGVKNSDEIQIYNSIVKIEDLSLEKILNKGVAETHIHISAGLNFESKWQSYMNYDKSIYSKELELISYGSFNEVKVKKCIYIAMILRAILAEFTSKRKEASMDKFFYFHDIEDENRVKEFYNIIMNTELDRMDCDKLSEIRDNIFESYSIESLGQNDSIEEENWLYKNNKDDFLSSKFNYRIKTTLENKFIFECFKYMNETREEDRIFIKLFYKYMFIKNSFYKISMEDNSIKGLDRFSKNFKVSGKYNNEGKKFLALNTQLDNSSLKKFEFRISFPEDKNKKISKMAKELKKIFEFYKSYLNNHESYNLVEIGIIYHLIKKEDFGAKCFREYIMYDKDNSRLYYEVLRNKYIEQIRCIKELRKNITYLSNYVVGIDAASIENYTDPWVFAPVFDEARDGIDSIYSNGYIGLKKPINNLGFTFHVGEEFRHIISGLRRIYEVINYFKFHTGDRIGHGIALGIDVEDWVEDNAVVILPRGEYLENLIWIWNMVTSYELKCNFDINYLERKIINLAKDIYGKNTQVDIYNLYDAYKNKFLSTEIDDRCRCGMEYSTCVSCENRVELNGYINSKDIYQLMHCKYYLEKIMEPIEIKVCRDEVELITLMQKTVGKLIAKEGIIIETNPTSNRVIGQIDNIFEHYISNINKIDSEENNMIVTINTDDPSVFNSNINNEYAYIFYSMLDKGYDRTRCLNWIDKIREDALMSSFIPDRCITKEIILEEVNQILKELDEMY